MNVYWARALAMLVLQHLWQGAVLMLLVWLVFRLYRHFGAQARSWIWLCAFVLAAILPLAVFLPADRSSQLPLSVAAPSLNPDSLPHSRLATTRYATTVPESGYASIRLERWGTLGFGLWLLGFLWSMRCLLASWKASRRLRKTAVSLCETPHRLPCTLTSDVPILVSDDIGSPMLIGLRHPCILFPRRLLEELPEATVHHLVLHELAHFRRGDMWIALAQKLCLAMYWWSPLLQLMRARLHMATEMACDEQAASGTAAGALDYANALLRTARYVGTDCSVRVFAAGVFDTRSALATRIEELLTMSTTKRTASVRPALIACMSVALASASLTLLATPRLGPAPSPQAHADSAGREGEAALLVEAASAGRLDVIRMLVGKGANVDASDPGNGTALIVASRRGNVAAVSELIALGANVDQPSLGDGNPLIAAAAYGHLDVAELLLNAGAHVNAIVKGDESPLINAARAGNLGMVKYLVEHGADVNLGTFADRHQWRSPLNQARGAMIQRYLIDKGARPAN